MMRAFFTIALALFGAAAGAAPRRGNVSDAPPPAVLVVRSASTPEAQKHERRLFDELGFALDGFMVLSQQAEAPNFSSLPLAEQIASVLPEATRNGAMVVVWLSFPLPNQVMLNLVAIGSGRAFVRTIETSRSPISETTLALMAKELLGTAYLFEAPKDVPVEVQAVVQSVRKQMPVEEAPAPPPAPQPAPEPSSPWSLWLGSSADYPVAGGEDAVPVWHAALAVERRLGWATDASLGLTGAEGSVSRPSAPGAQFLSGGLSLAAYRGFAWRAVSAGPYASAAVSYASFHGTVPPLSTALPAFELGAQGRSEADSGLNVAARISATYTPVRAELRSGDGQLLYRTPTVGLALGVAVGWRGL
jgi:hypothetical protein